MSVSDDNLEAQAPQPSRIGRSALMVHGLSVVAMVLAGMLMGASRFAEEEISTTLAMGAVSLSAALVLWGWSLLLTTRSLQARENPDCATIILAATGLEFVLVLTMIG